MDIHNVYINQLFNIKINVRPINNKKQLFIKYIPKTMAYILCKECHNANYIVCLQSNGYLLLLWQK